MLSHSMVKDLCKSSFSAFIRREKYINSFVVCKIASSLVSVDEVVTVSCLLALHATDLPNNFIV